MRSQQRMFEAIAAGKVVSDSLIDEAARELNAEAIEFGCDPASPGVSKWRRDLRATAVEHNRSLAKRTGGARCEDY